MSVGPLETYRSLTNSENFTHDKSVQEVLEICFYSLRKKAQIHNQSIDSIVEYLHSEWLYTFSDLQLAYQDDQIWQNLKIPTRLKIELKRYILKSDYNSNSNFSHDEDNIVERIERSSSIPLNANDGFRSSETEYAFEQKSTNEKDEPPEDILSHGIEKVTCEVWSKCFSVEHNYYYYYNNVTQETQWECPDDTKIYVVYNDYVNEDDDGSQGCWQEHKGDDDTSQQPINDENDPYCININEENAESYDMSAYNGEVTTGIGYNNEEYEPELASTPYDFQSISAPRSFSKPRQKNGKTIFAESPVSNLSSIFEQENSPHSVAFYSHTTTHTHSTAFPFDVIDEKEDDPDEVVPFTHHHKHSPLKVATHCENTYASPLRPTNNSSHNVSDSEVDDDNSSDFSEYFAVSSDLQQSSVHRQNQAQKTVLNAENLEQLSLSLSPEKKPPPSATRVRVPPLAIPGTPSHPQSHLYDSNNSRSSIDLMMVNRDDFLFGSNDSYSVNLRDLAIGDPLGSRSSDESAQHQKENTKLEQLNQQPQSQPLSPHQPRRSLKMTDTNSSNNTTERSNSKSKRLSQTKGPPLQTKPQPKPPTEDSNIHFEAEVATNKFKKKSSTTKKVFKFMNSIVGSHSDSKTLNSMSSPNLRAVVNNHNKLQPPSTQSGIETPANIPKGSEFAQTLRRIEDQQQLQQQPEVHVIEGNSGSESLELQYHDVYPKCSDELNNSRLIAGVNSLNSAHRRASGGSFCSENTNNNANNNPINSGRTTLDSQRTISTMNTAVPPLEHNSCVIYNLPVTSIASQNHKKASKNSNKTSSASSGSDILQCSSEDSKNSIGLVSSSSGDATFNGTNHHLTDVKSFLTAMQSLGFTEKECNHALDVCNNHIMQASAYLLEAPLKDKELSEVSAIEEKKKRHKLKKSMFKFFPYDL